jgi:DNA polymerase III subunit epsilon
LDFETTGLSPGWGDRAIEVAVVVVQNGVVGDRFQSLMNPGGRVPAFIEQLTGITNDMIESAPSATRVMRDVASFVGGLPLVAHHASFDQRFWIAELERAGRRADHSFACSMRAARRIYQDSPNHRLDTLVHRLRIPVNGRHHRALADAEMTAHLLMRMGYELQRRFRIDQLTHDLLREVQRVPKKKFEAWGTARGNGEGA